MSNSNRPIIRDVLVLALVRLLLNMPRRFSYPFIPEISRELNTSLQNIQIAVALQAGVGVLSPIISPKLEHLGRKRSMLIGLSLVCIVLAVAFWFSTLFAAFLVMMIGVGLGKWIFDPAMQAYIADRVSYRRRGLALGTVELSWAFALLITAPIVGFLLSRGGLNTVYALLLTVNFIGLILIWRVLPSDNDPQNKLIAPKLRAIIALFRAQPMALAAVMFSMLLFTANEMLFIVYGAWMEKTFALKLAELGVLTIIISAAEVTGEMGVMGFSDRIGKRRMVIGGALISSLCYAILPHLSFSLPLFLLGLFILFVAVECSIVAAIPLFTEVMPQARVSMMSANVAAQALGRFSGAFLGGVMYAIGGFVLVGFVALILGLSAVGLMWRVIRIDEASAPT